jgi:hypothetical protein
LVAVARHAFKAGFQPASIRAHPFPSVVERRFGFVFKIRSAVCVVNGGEKRHLVAHET